MKRSHDAFTHELADPPPISPGSPPPPPKLGSQDFKLLPSPNLQPNLPPHSQSKIISREEALNHLAASAPYQPSNPAPPVDPQPSSPHNNQHTTPSTISIRCEPSITMALHSDHTLEFEIQQEMGMVWRGHQQAQQPIDTTSPASSTHSSSPSRHWLDSMCIPVTLPESQDPVPTVTMPRQAVHASIPSIDPSRRRQELESQNEETRELVNLGEKLQKYARQQAHTINNELATSHMESQ